MEEYARGRPHYQVLLRGGGRNRASARNLGASLAAGDVFFFLDGDGVFLEDHLHECLSVLRSHPEVDFVKSQAMLSDPVHPDWVARIVNSLAMNLGVRRRCHERVGGFPDRHVFRRHGGPIGARAGHLRIDRRRLLQHEAHRGLPRTGDPAPTVTYLAGPVTLSIDSLSGFKPSPARAVTTWTNGTNCG